MLNIPAIKVIEAAVGQKIPAIFSNLSGVSERTFRKTSWSGKTIKCVEEGARSNIVDKLMGLEWPAQEVDVFMSNYPGSPYAGLIYECQMPGVVEFTQTIEFASLFDEISSSLFKAREQNSLEEFKLILLSSESLDHRYYVSSDDEWNSLADPKALNLIKSAKDWSDIEKLLGVLVSNTLFSIMAHWDIEFCRQYFSELEPRSLFSMVLPKLDPDAVSSDEPKIGKKRGIFWLPVKRLIDLMACIGHYNRNNGWPDSVPRVADITRMTGDRERELVNWRDGTKRFMIGDFRRLWREFYPDTIAPTPLFIAATMWQTYFVKVGVNKKTKTMFLFDDRYQRWWEMHFTKLANDLSLSSEEKDRWPACFDAI